MRLEKLNGTQTNTPCAHFLQNEKFKMLIRHSLAAFENELVISAALHELSIVHCPLSIVPIGIFDAIVDIFQGEQHQPLCLHSPTPLLNFISDRPATEGKKKI